MSEKLEKTTDYSIFEMHPCNRPLAERKLLEKSMQERGFMPSSAIHVKKTGKGKLKVIRGHHRLHCAKRLKLPVFYIIDDTDVDIFDLEGDGRVAWSMKDFALARSSDGDAACSYMIAFQKKHNLTMGVAASLVYGESAGSHNAQQYVKEGKFKVGDQSHANKVVCITDVLLELGISFATSMLFIKALSAAIRVPEFDTDVFLSKARLYPMNIHRRTSAGEYMDEIESLYNYQSKSPKSRIPLAFRAKEVQLKRQKTFGGTNK
jgi:hypothetical protein